MTFTLSVTPNVSDVYYFLLLINYKLYTRRILINGKLNYKVDSNKWQAELQGGF